MGLITDPPDMTLAVDGAHRAPTRLTLHNRLLLLLVFIKLLIIILPAKSSFSHYLVN